MFIKSSLVISLKASMTGEDLFLTVIKMEFAWEKLKNVNNQWW
jgi:hypothetical protein